MNERITAGSRLSADAAEQTADEEQNQSPHDEDEDEGEDEQEPVQTLLYTCTGETHTSPTPINTTGKFPSHM